jgi:Spy/CpxP family protein refolding chaperone
MSTEILERLPVGRSRSERMTPVVALVLFFLCGAVVGALAMNSSLHARLHQPAFDTPAGKTAFFNRLQKELNLTPVQSEQMQSVLNDMWQYYRTVLSDSKSRVDQLLTPEQRTKFERILQQQLR